MTIVRTLAALTIVATIPAGAAPASTNAKTETSEIVESVSDKAVDGATPETVALIASCSEQKFETSVEVGEGDSRHLTKVKLCSKPGQSKEQWIATLRDAATKIGGNLELAPISRDKLVAAIEAEIARLKS